MGRARGTYTVHTNWVDDLAPTLPGAAGWVLTKLDAQSNYKRQEMTLGQLIDCLPYKERTVQLALAHLRQEGYIVAHNGAQVLRGACAELAQDLHKNVHPQWDVKTVQDSETMRVYFSISAHNQKKSERSEIREEVQEINPTAQESTAPVQAPPCQESVPETNTPPIASETNAPVFDKVAGGAAQQLMFGALALACYGGHDSLTDAARRRVASAAKSLTKANFTNEDVPLIVAWMQTTEGESWRSVTVSNIEDRAPVWRSALRGSLPLSVAQPKVIKFNRGAKTTEEANDRVRSRAAELYAAKGAKHVF